MKRSERIYYDLNESKEVVELLETKFYFSSSFNKERFLRGYESYIKEEEDKLIARYGINISITCLSARSLFSNSPILHQ